MSYFLSQLAQGTINFDGNNFNTNLPAVSADRANLTIALQIVFGVIGTVAVIILLFQAIKFTTSQGDPKSTNEARQGIIFAIVGLVIAVSAEVIVTFVLGAI